MIFFFIRDFLINLHTVYNYARRNKISLLNCSETVTELPISVSIAKWSITICNILC